MVVSDHPSVGSRWIGLTGVPDATTVGLDADLHKALSAFLADGLDSQHRRVGMGTDHRD